MHHFCARDDRGQFEHVISYWMLIRNFIRRHRRVSQSASRNLNPSSPGDRFGAVFLLSTTSYLPRPRPVDNPLHGVTGDRDVLSTTDQASLTTDQTSCGSPWSAPAISA